MTEEEFSEESCAVSGVKLTGTQAISHNHSNKRQEI